MKRKKEWNAAHSIGMGCFGGYFGRKEVGRNCSAFSGLAVFQREAKMTHFVHSQRVQQFALEKCAFEVKNQEVLSGERVGQRKVWRVSGSTLI